MYLVRAGQFVLQISFDSHLLADCENGANLGVARRFLLHAHVLVTVTVMAVGEGAGREHDATITLKIVHVLAHCQERAEG